MPSNSMYEISPESFPVNYHIDERGPLFDTFLSYEGPHIVKAVILYDSTMLRLIHLMERLLLFNTSLTLDHQWEHMSLRTQVRAFTDEICRSLPYMIEPLGSSPGGVTTQLIIIGFACRSVYVMVDGPISREGRFVERVVEYITLTTRSVLCMLAIDKDMDVIG